MAILMGVAGNDFLTSPRNSRVEVLIEALMNIQVSWEVPVCRHGLASQNT